MNLTKVLIETSERRVSIAPSISALTVLKKELSGSQSETFSIDLLLEEALRENGDNLVNNNLTISFQLYVSLIVMTFQVTSGKKSEI